MSDLDIKKIRKKLGLTQKQMAEKLGVSPNTIQNWEYGGVIPQSKYQLLGNLLKPQQYYGGEAPVQPAVKESSLPLIPIEAVAGFPAGDKDGISLMNCEQYNVPDFASKGAQYLIRVSGSSMYPKYSNGDILACRKIESVTFFQWGKVYVLDTSQGALVKRLFEDKENPDNVICHSDNHENYPNFSIPKSEIRSLSIVIGVIRLE